MKSNTLFIVIPVCSALTFFAINTPVNFSDTGSSATNTEEITMMTKGAWKIKSIISDKPCDTDGDGRYTTNIASEMPSCALDDVMVIYTSGKAVFKRNIRCEGEESREEIYHWKLTGDDRFILSKGGYETAMNFQYVTADEMVMVIPTEAMGELYSFTVTYFHP